MLQLTLATLGATTEFSWTVSGVNTAIYSPSGSSGIGFAIPVNTSRIVPELITYGRVQTPILGIIQVPPTTTGVSGILKG